MVDTDDTRRMTYNGRRTTPWVWHKLPTGELKITKIKILLKDKHSFVLYVSEDQTSAIVTFPACCRASLRNLIFVQ